MEKVYHADIYMPEQVYMQAALALCETGGKYLLNAHAQERVVEKSIALPESIPIHKCTIVEVTGNPMRKYLIRFPFGGRDVVMSLTKVGRVLTIWNNDLTDRHSTLDHSKYEVAP